jgi:hypothetical protein
MTSGHFTARCSDSDAAREQGVGAAAGYADHRVDGCAEDTLLPAAQQDALTSSQRRRGRPREAFGEG